MRSLSLDIEYPASSIDSIKEIDLEQLKQLVENEKTKNQEIPSTSENCDKIDDRIEIENPIEAENSADEVFEMENQEPTAPNFDMEASVEVVKQPIPQIHTAPILHHENLYPDLQEIAPAVATSTAITEKILSPVGMKPFSAFQMEQLYSNPQLQWVEMFETEFVEKELKDNSIQDHPLYVLLRKYAKARSKFLVNENKIAEMTKILDENYKNIWRVEKRTANGSGTCECGKIVFCTHKYDYAVFDEEINGDMSKNLKSLINLTCFNHTKYSQDYELYRRQIEQLIGELMSHKSFSQITKDSPVVLIEEITQLDQKRKMTELRFYISILFNFLRLAIHDKILIASVQEWIRKLVALQLRLATWQDHVFILFHILRCPVNVGNWAANLIQVPISTESTDSFDSPFSLPELQHCIAILSALLLPVKDRGAFLEGITKDLAPKFPNSNEDAWILVDSDGEEGSSPTGECIGLKENDLVAIYDQIPFEMLFELVTHTRKKGETSYMNESKISGHHIIKTIAFSSKFIGILKRGLTTYDSERYKQFAKRLGRLMKHTLAYVSDLIQIYRNRDGYKDAEEFQRIQVEFDELILRSAHFIYESKKLSLFQYLADFPYQHMSIKSVWKLFFCLHTGDFKVVDEEISRLILDESFGIKFNDDVATDDLFFLLHAFSQMAMSKGREDWDFILFVTLDILQIGFINESTKDFCYNTAEDLLANITTKYPELIADIFNNLKENLRKMGPLGTYLFKALPIAKWKPRTEDLEVLASWLLNFEFESLENTAARVIFAYMNWNFDTNGELFLSHEVHTRMAFLVCEVYMKHIGESIGSGVNETARQLGNGKKNPTKKEQFSMWCWGMVSVLRLHYMDLNDHVARSLLQDPGILNRVPEIEKTHGIYQGLTEQKPLAIYLALLVSQIGHSIPQICHQGFELLRHLLNDYRHSKVIKCLEMMTPLFIQCPNSLYSCDNFMTILATIFGADKTYLKIAKDLMVLDSHGPILTFFGNMIQNQLMNFARYGLTTPTSLVLMWVNCLTRLKDWNKDLGVVWVLDVICQIAYQYPESWSLTRETLRPLVTRIVDTKIPKTSGLLTLISSEEKDILMSPLVEGSTISFMLIELEFENIEINTGFWSEFLCQIVMQGNTSLSNVLKKTLTSKQLPNFPVQSLAIFKLAKLIMKMHPKHWIFPVICQQFFSIYMSRVPGEVTQDYYGVQDKFYDSDVSMMKKLKIIFTDSRKLHIEFSTKHENEVRSQFHSNCAKIFETFLYWLEENQINRMTQAHISLPPQYDHPRLKLIFQGNRNHWMEFVNFPELQSAQRSDCHSWQAICLRYASPTPNTSSNISGLNPRSSEVVKENLYSRLKMSGTPLPPPELVKEQTHIGQVDASKYTLNLLRLESKTLQAFAHKFNLMVNEHKAVDAAYRDSIRHAYTNEQSIRIKSASCARVFDSCQGSTTVRLEFSEAKANERIKNRLRDNRDFQKQLIRKEITPPDPKVVDANFCLYNVIEQLLDKYDYHQKRNETDQCNEILKIGTSFFYEVLKDISEEIQSCPVTHELYSEAISKLGTFVQQNHNTEGLNLLKLALQRPNLVKMIAELFTPSVSSPQYFLEMYGTLVESYAKRCDPQLLFVLFSKFDLPKWLQINKPKLIEVSNLIQLVLRGLELWNLQNSELLQDLLRCHLVCLFLHRFPEHYGEILQNILNGFSNQRLKPNVLMDILNAFYQHTGCKKLDADISVGRLKDEMRNFASKQNVLMYQDVHSTSLMFASHFCNERLQFGLHGLYPKFSEYCDVLSLLYGSIGHSAVASAIQAYPGIMADQLVNWLWPCINEMFAPWLNPYYPQTMKDAPASWIKQFNVNNSVLLPWSEVHAESAKKMIKMFAMCLQYILDMLPASNLLLSHLFCWYDGYFAYKSTAKHVLNPIQTLLIKMPWERFRPAPVHMEGFNRILTDFIPECHLFIGNVFLRISWTQWMQQMVGSWDQTNQKMLAILFMTTVKLSYEPKVRESIRIIQILQESLKYPWYLLEFKDVESVLDWFVMSAEPAVILKIPSEHQNIDTCVIKLLEVASCMTELPKDVQVQKSVVVAKRMAYVRSIVRIMKSCDAKMNQLMTTQQGREMFNQAGISLMNSIDHCYGNSSDSQMDITNILIPITQGMAVPESTSKLFAESLSLWQTSSQTGNVVVSCMLDALKVQKQWTIGVYQLLESTLLNYMRVSELSPNHTPTWTETHQKMGIPLFKPDFGLLINNEFYLACHLLAYMKILSLPDDFERVEFLQELQTKLAEKKTSETTESQVVLIWGFLIMSGAHILQRSEMSMKQLLIIARYFQVNLTQPEGWGEGLLGAIGLRRDGQTNKKKILLRCFSCLIFSIFDKSSANESNSEFDNAMSELKTTLSNKKFADVRMEGLQAISLIESKKSNMMNGINDTITSLIRFFYSDSYLNSIEYFYHW